MLVVLIFLNPSLMIGRRVLRTCVWHKLQGSGTVTVTLLKASRQVTYLRPTYYSRARVRRDVVGAGEMKIVCN